MTATNMCSNFGSKWSSLPLTRAVAKQAMHDDYCHTYIYIYIYIPCQEQLLNKLCLHRCPMYGLLESKLEKARRTN